MPIPKHRGGSKTRFHFDLEDAMKVQTRGNRVIGIGKDLRNYDAVDTGLLVCPLEIFDYLERSKQNGDCSLADEFGRWPAITKSVP